MKLFLRALPLLMILTLALMLAGGLLFKNTEKTQRHYAVAPFDIPSLDGGRFSPELWKNKVVVVNAFASWCLPCAAEHPVLMKLAASGKVVLYGIAWKDRKEKIVQYLETHGNPYAQVGFDAQGETTTALGISGVPETFVIDKTGQVVYNFKSALTDKIAEDTIIPLVERLAHE